MLALALISVKIVLKLFLKSCMSYNVICLTTKKSKKIRASLSTDSVSLHYKLVALSNVS